MGLVAKTANVSYGSTPDQLGPTELGPLCGVKEKFEARRSAYGGVPDVTGAGSER